MSTLYESMDPQHLLAVAHMEARTPLELALVARLEADDEEDVRGWLELADEHYTDPEEIRELMGALHHSIDHSIEILDLCAEHVEHDLTLDKLRRVFSEHEALGHLLKEHGLKDVAQLRDLINKILEVV